MNIINTIAVSLLLLWSGCTVQASQRRWTPAEAERRARTGAFDSADKDQLLADLPEEWKKEHRHIVRQIERGKRAKDDKKIETTDRTTFPEREPLPVMTDEFDTEEIPELIDEPKERSLEEKKLFNENFALRNIVMQFADNLDSMYEKTSFENKRVYTFNEAFKLSFIKNEYYTKLVNLMNVFLGSVVNLERNKEKRSINTIVNSNGIKLLNELTRLKEENENNASDALRLAVMALQTWKYLSLDNYIAESNIEDFETFAKALELARKNFALYENK